ncbi:MAG: hypothetical protein R3B09_29305 [Nannocystaceae bacterium]
MSTPLRYLDPECPMTLAEGLEEFEAAQDGLITIDESSEVGRLTKAHDCCHVVFGLTTEIEDEALADTWTIFGSTVSLREYTRFLQHDEYKQLVKDIGTWELIRGSVKSLPNVLRVIRRSRRMTEKWPFFDYARFLDTPIVELRRHFGIEVLPH